MTFDLLGLFGAGLLTFASPCILPLMPAYLSVLAGGSVTDIRTNRRRAGTVFSAFAFALGLGLVFVLLGLAATAVGGTVLEHRLLLQQLGGLVVFTFGLKLLGVLHLPWLERDARPMLTRVGGRGGVLGSFALGAAFSLGWSPCVGPILGSVLTYAATQGASTTAGALYLATYAAGLALPLVLGAAIAPTALRWQRAMVGHLRRIEIGAGALLVLLGALLVTDELNGLVPNGTPSVANAAHSDVTGSLPATELPCEQEGASICMPESISGDEGSLSPTPVGELEATVPDPYGRRGPRLVEFVSGSCPVCERMGPVLASAEAACPGLGVSVVKVGVDEEPGRRLASRSRVRGVPTFVFVDAEGQETARLVGEQPLETITQSLEVLAGRTCSGFSELPK